MEEQKELFHEVNESYTMLEAINEAIILDGPYSNSSYDIVSKNDKIYIIPGGKSLTGDNSFNKAGSVMIYDYEKMECTRTFRRSE